MIELSKNYVKTHAVALIVASVIIATVILCIRGLLVTNNLTTKVSALPLRTNPDVTAKKLTTLPKGTHLIVLKTKNGWSYVRRNDNDNDRQTGWVATWVATNADLDKVTPLSEATIHLDAGHGGHDSGAISNDGKSFEKTYTLKTAKAVQKALKKYGTRVVMTRTDDSFMALAKIPELSKKVNADIFTSFHFDSSDEANTATGVTQYYYHPENGSQTLAQLVSHELNNLPLVNRGVDYGNFQVLRDNAQTAILLENGYMNNDDDLTHIQSNSYRQLVARDVVKAYKKYIDSIAQ